MKLQKIKRKEILRKYLPQLVENIGIEQQDINTFHTSRATQIRLVDNSINALKLPNILTHSNIYSKY